ncbi:MAG: GatB/YqeY domain-containing protein [Myxococcota bacterium]|jgi:hypothetical protein|nr:GatB/YqeY domain-containing protein [Myxococcota bacterium]
MKSKSADELRTLRMVKSAGQIAKTAPGFSGETNDAFWIEVISKYVKQQKKAIEEFEKAGAGAAAQISELRFEIDYLEPFLPQKATEDEIREMVRKAIEQTGATSAKMVGKVMGAVMKDHKDRVDADIVKRIATQELG